MIRVIGAFCVVLVGLGGYCIGAGYAPLGVIIASPGAISLGLTIAYLQEGMWSGRRFDGGLTVGTVRGLIFREDHTMPIYVANPDLAPAGGLYTARIDGQRVLVIEKGDAK